MENELVAEAKAELGGNPKIRIPLVDIIIINIPVILFSIGAGLGIVLCLSIDSVLRWIPLFLSWWCVCGGFMLGRDFYLRKRLIYLRLRSNRPAPPRSALAMSLKQTVCGFLTYLAAKRYWLSYRSYVR